MTRMSTSLISKLRFNKFDLVLTTSGWNSFLLKKETGHWPRARDYSISITLCESNLMARKAQRVWVKSEKVCLTFSFILRNTIGEK